MSCSPKKFPFPPHPPRAAQKVRGGPFWGLLASVLSWAAMLYYWL